jgi:hypothetical protein
MSREQHHHLAAVTVHPRQANISLWTDIDPTNPVCYSYTQDPKDLTGCYLDGILSMLQFLQSVSVKSAEIHMDHLHTYNILTRFLPKWKLHSWHTSQNKPVSHKAVLKQIDGILQQRPDISFRNYSREFIHLDYPLRRAKECNVAN